MLNREEIISEIAEAARAKTITRREINEAFDAGSGKPTGNLSTVLSYIGGALVLIGILIYFGQQWHYLVGFVKIGLTLGIGSLLYIAGMLFYRETRTRVASYGLLLAAFLMLPFGFYTAVKELGIGIVGRDLQLVIAVVMTAIAFITLVAIGHTFFVLLSIGFSTWLYYAAIAWITQNSDFGGTFYAYTVLAQGIIYLLLGYYFAITVVKHRGLSGFLYALGGIATLSGTFYFATEHTFHGSLWLWMYPLVIFGALSLSVRLGSKSILTFTAIALISYVSYITGRFFADSLGWPIVLMIIGLAIIAVAVGSVQVGKRYLKPATPN